MRITEKTNVGYVFAKSNFSDDLSKHNEELEVAINKLLDIYGQLEDIKEKLGIDLITFFKIYNTDHFYIKGKEYPFKIRHYQKHGIMVGTNKPRYLPFKDYGKTWSLNKEGLL